MSLFYTSKRGEMQKSCNPSTVSIIEFQRTWEQNAVKVKQKYPTFSFELQRYFADRLTFFKFWPLCEFPGRVPTVVPEKNLACSAGSAAYEIQIDAMFARSLQEKRRIEEFLEVYSKIVEGLKREFRTRPAELWQYHAEKQLWEKFWADETFPVIDPTGLPTDAKNLITEDETLEHMGEAINEALEEIMGAKDAKDAFIERWLSSVYDDGN